MGVWSLVMIFILISAFLTKHAVCDFWLQTNWMQGKVSHGSSWLLPMAAHCLVTACGTLVVLLILAPEYWWLSAFDFALHFVIDRVKALFGQSDLRKLSGRVAFSMDQLAHQFCYVAYSYVIWRELL
jgi:hypothetical protein